MKAGIYQIRNLINKKLYIGSAVDLKDRWRCHQKEANYQTHHSPKLQNAWNKYGADAFIFEVLLYCDPKNCLMYEQIALDHYQPEYNICKIAGSSLGVKRSKKTCQKIGNSKRGINHPNYGKSLSETTRSKIGNANRGKQRSKEACKKMSDAARGHQRNVGVNHPMYGKHHSVISNAKRSFAMSGEKNSKAKLTYKQVQSIKDLLNDGISQTIIAHQFKVSKSTISKIKLGKTWV